MEITECDELKTFETMPTETTLYFSAYTTDGVYWFGGPSANSKQEVIGYLQNYGGVIAARIYSVKLPITLKPS